MTLNRHLKRRKLFHMICYANPLTERAIEIGAADLDEPKPGAPKVVPLSLASVFAPSPKNGVDTLSKTPNSS
jgi:hypothetical protein